VKEQAMPNQTAEITRELLWVDARDEVTTAGVVAHAEPAMYAAYHRGSRDGAWYVVASGLSREQVENRRRWRVESMPVLSGLGEWLDAEVGARLQDATT
jgi:hypothetical protein